MEDKQKKGLSMPKEARFFASILTAVILAFGIISPVHARDQIRIVGSSTVFPFSTAVAETTGQKYGIPTPVVESTGTGGGLKLFCQGVGEETPDIANASRAIKKSEIELCAKNAVTAITEVKIGFDGIVLANSKQAAPMAITLPQLWLALAKNVPQNGTLVPNNYNFWSDIDGTLPSVRIEVYGPPPTSGTRDAWVELVMNVGCKSFPEIVAIPDADKASACGTVREDGAYIDSGENDNLIVQKLEANLGSFGIFGYSYLEQNSDKLRGNQIAGEEPSFENIAKGSYPVARALYFYVKNAHVGLIPNIPTFVKEFVAEETIGPDGFLSDKGLIPLPDDERASVQLMAPLLNPISP